MPPGRKGPGSPVPSVWGPSSPVVQSSSRGNTTTVGIGYRPNRVRVGGSLVRRWKLKVALRAAAPGRVGPGRVGVCTRRGERLERFLGRMEVGFSKRIRIFRGFVQDDEGV